MTMQAPWWRRWATSPIVLTLVLLLVLEGGLRLLAALRGDDTRRLYGDARLARAYPTMDVPSAVRLVEESYLPAEYEAYTGFRERPRSGKYVNVDPNGFRWGPKPLPWPIDPQAYNIFMFGGSTTFGYGAADSATIPALLQMRLDQAACSAPVHVYNFGRGWYFSSQEQSLFAAMLRSGIHPSLAVFLDGTNDSQHSTDLPTLAPETARLFEYTQSGVPVSAVLRIGASRTAIGRAAVSIARRLVKPPAVETPDSAQLDALGALMAGRWMATRRLAEADAKANGIATLFVIQPSPYYAMDLSTHPFREWLKDVPTKWSFFVALDRQRASGTLGSVLWLADLQRGRDGADLYVDDEHYTKAFSTEIAESLAVAIRSGTGACGAHVR